MRAAMFAALGFAFGALFPALVTMCGAALLGMSLSDSAKDCTLFVCMIFCAPMCAFGGALATGEVLR